MERYKGKCSTLEKLEQQKDDKEKRLFDCMRYIESIKSLDNCIDFSEKLWLSLVDHVTVPESGDKTLVFHLRNGELKNVIFTSTKVSH